MFQTTKNYFKVDLKIEIIVTLDSIKIVLFMNIQSPNAFNGYFKGIT